MSIVKPIRMRCVCLREPWLWLMLELEPPWRKNVENRSRCLVRTLGPMLVKSSARKPKVKGYDQDLAYYEATRKRVVDDMRLVPGNLFPDFDRLQFGGIRGAFNFAEMLEPHDIRDEKHPWKFSECFGYVVDRVVTLPFRKVKGGAQGIFYPEITDAEAAALRAAALLKEAS